MNRPLTKEESKALASYAARNGRAWKSKLQAAWLSGGNEDGTQGVLRALRNSHGPSWLRGFRVTDES
jgi:hypothetical protein